MKAEVFTDLSLGIGKIVIGIFGKAFLDSETGLAVQVFLSFTGKEE